MLARMRSFRNAPNYLISKATVNQYCNVRKKSDKGRDGVSGVPLSPLNEHIVPGLGRASRKFSAQRDWHVKKQVEYPMLG